MSIPQTITTEIVMPHGHVRGQIIISILGDVSAFQLGRLIHALTEVFQEVPFATARKGHSELKLRMAKDVTPESAIVFRERVADIAAQEMSR